jgi:hypothetical protein
MRSASRLFFSLKLLAELLLIVELPNKLLEIVELLTDELLEIVELFDEKIQGVLLAKCCSSLDGYRNSLPHFLHTRSLLERLLASFFL